QRSTHPTLGQIPDRLAARAVREMLQLSVIGIGPIGIPAGPNSPRAEDRRHPAPAGIPGIEAEAEERPHETATEPTMDERSPGDAKAAGPEAADAGPEATAAKPATEATAAKPATE